MRLRRLVIVRHLDAFTGYGIAANNLTVELVKIGFDVAIRPTVVSEPFGSKIPIEIKSRIVHRVQPDDVELIIHPAPLSPTPEKLTAFFTMHESTRLQEIALKNLNASELVITPSNWGASCFSAQGVNTAIRVVNLGCDWKYEQMPRIDGNFVFAAAGRLSHGGTRKGIEMVVDCFSAAFDPSENVRLNLKLHPDCKFTDPKDSRISVTKGFISEEQMKRWMAQAHVFVTASRGEGWGMHQHESMAIGRPVIGAIATSLSEFMNRHNCFPLRFKYVEGDGFYEKLGNLIEIDEWSMVEQMRFAYENRAIVEQKGWQAFQDVKHLTWASSAQQLLAVLEESGVI